MRALPYVRRHASTDARGMSCMAGMAFILVLFYMAIGRPQSPFAEPYVQLPTATRNYICLPEGHNLTISIDAKARAYIAVDNQNLQMAIIQQVAKEHQVLLSAAQLRELRNTLFLSQDIRQLPMWLSASMKQRQQLSTGIPAISGNNQLSEYIATSRSVCRALYGSSLRVYLRLDGSLSNVQVKSLFHLLQSQGIQWVTLVTEPKPNSI